MAETSDLLIMWAVILVRLLVPLAIPRYPLPGILVALVADAVDYTVIRDWTSVPMEGYQGFDKALDIYYLTIGYISTLRNWTNLFAFQVSRFLFYWRLAGVVLTRTRTSRRYSKGLTLCRWHVSSTTWCSRNRSGAHRWSRRWSRWSARPGSRRRSSPWGGMIRQRPGARPGYPKGSGVIEVRV